MPSSIDNTTSNCASCGKEGGNLNTCNKCNMVKYCNAACKKKHRSKHKKQCERRVAELRDEELFRDPPPREDCPICFIPLPLRASHTTFQSCCGRVICDGCIHVIREEARGRGKIDLCAFCRTPRATSDADRVKRLKKMAVADNAYAFRQLAGCYYMGEGVPQDFAKANELFLRAGELGCAKAYYNLANCYYHGRDVEMNKKKAIHYWELAAMAGHVQARHNLGYMEVDAGNIDRAYKHYILAAKAGYKKSLDRVKTGYMSGLVTKDEYENTLRAYQSRQDEMKSDNRDKAEAFRAERNGQRR